MVLGKGIAHPCLFLHLPKCGGTSLSEALYAAVPLQQRVGVIDALATRRAAAIAAFDKDDPWLCHEDLEHGEKTFALREHQVLVHMCWDTRLIHGHVLYSDSIRRHFAERYRIVTIMRTPVERAISNFSMAAQAGLVSPDPEAWIESAIGRRHATVNLRYLSGRNTVTSEDEPECLAVALETLDRLALVGFLDDLPTFVRGFADLFGPLIVLHHYNQAKGATITLSGQQRRRLEQLCASDIAIHDRAKRKFG